MAARFGAAIDERATGDRVSLSTGRPRARQLKPTSAKETGSVLSALPSDFSTSALLASLVHELRTPVAALATGSELLLDDLDRLSRDELQRIVETMHRGAVWLQGLIENVLYAATVAEGHARIYPRELDLVDLARDVVPVVDPLLRQRDQTLRIVDRVGGLRVAADGRRMGQVLVNLIANASKYSRPGTRIDVMAAKRGSAVRLSVADRGPGLPPGAREHLFAPYTRASDVGLAGIDGAGLGLAIVRSIVDLHGGSVGALPRRGGGAVFWVQLPIVAPSDVAQGTDLAASGLRERPA